MSTEIVLLGTAGGPRAHAGRAAPAQALVVDGQTYLVDFGNGIARQMAAAGLGVGRVRAGFLTHQHSDHNADVCTLFHTQIGQMEGGVELIGPPPLASMVDDYCRMQAGDIAARRQHSGAHDLRTLLEVREISEAGRVYEDDLVRVTATRVVHPPIDPAFAFRFDTADGAVVFSGDTAPSDALVQLATGADVLVHEVIDLDRIAQLVQENRGARVLEHLRESHTSVHQVGALAARAGVRVLVLSHLVPAEGLTNDEWQGNASTDFEGRVVVGEDLMRLQLPGAPGPASERSSLPWPADAPS